MNQPTMVHQQPLPPRRMGVSIGAMFFTSIEAAQAHLEREADAGADRPHRRALSRRHRGGLSHGHR